jgi:hypothetical protein
MVEHKISKEFGEEGLGLVVEMAKSVIMAKSKVVEERRH